MILVDALPTTEQSHGHGGPMGDGLWTDGGAVVIVVVHLKQTSTLGGIEPWSVALDGEFVNNLKERDIVCVCASMLYGFCIINQPPMEP